MATPQLTAILSESRAAMRESHQLLETMRALRAQVSRQVADLKTSAALLSSSVSAAVTNGTAVTRMEADILAPPENTAIVQVTVAGERDQQLLQLLTRRELEVLRLIGEGQRTKEIAFNLGITFKTAVTHRSNIMEKLGIHEGPRLVRFAIRTGITAA